MSQPPPKPASPDLHLPQLCVALSGEGMDDRARALMADFCFFEFRLDSAPDPHEALFAMGALLRAHPGLRAIATCRRTANGGSFAGTAADEIDMLRQAGTVGAHIVDLSLETAEEQAINPRALDSLRRGPARLLLSWHDFRGTPPLEPVLGRMQHIGADLYKVVPTAMTLTDSLCLIDLLEKHGASRTLVAMSMGFPGVLTRVLGPRFGSLFTFAAPAAGAETAPGQVDAHTLTNLYRISSITAGTEVYGVFGKPVTGSGSPVMLNTAFCEAGRNAVYLPLQTDDAGELFATAERLCMAGASVTMPLKEAVLPGLAEVAPEARALGAANTLRRMPTGTLVGSNTDVIGILRPLLQHTSLQGRQALVLGAGGVARAAVFALRREHCQVTIANRTVERAQQLADELGASVMDLDGLPGRHFDVVLNATPCGMPSSSMAAPIDFSRTSCGLFFDLVYNPVETPLVLAARRHAVPVIYGVDMFLAQGAAQFTAWTGSEAPSVSMRRAVLDSLA